MNTSATTLVTACDKSYAYAALDLVGSVQKQSPIFKEILVYDLGMTKFQRRLFTKARGVRVLEVEHFTEYWQQCWSWKAWIWKNAPVQKMLYLDSGMEVLRDLTPLVEEINDRGYFAVSQSEKGTPHLVEDIMPQDYYSAFSLDQKKIAKKDVVAAGILGFDTKMKFYNTVIIPTYDEVVAGRNLGWSKSELGRNSGIHYMEHPIVRDCNIFRHDQTVLNALIYKNLPDLHLHNLSKYAGYRSAQDVPDQYIWHHRKQSRLPYINHIEYTTNQGGYRLISRMARKLGL